ncbi:polysaccharide deacetylase [Chlorella sorokiniana]|uniref:Polysaccharide deacetylase n=1 Tax=Chlorella sorokiniana TaxID=3076 RepID=A0A2P6U021_CHLSO|nr:polysaccharide deacetylase [Chlorella sorokiniana]|eukprot:PRW59662.1 polysaccharide deacetylase [Chlorella sorokiniana]
MPRNLGGRCLAALAALLIAAVPATAAIDASLTSPLGNNGGKPPQFVLFTHDDAVTEQTHKLMLAVTEGRKSATNDCPAVATMFVTTANGQNDCELMMDLYHKGYEIADHTVSHNSVRGVRYSQVADEIVGLRDRLVKQCGIPKQDIVGFRAPYLSTDENVRKVLAANKFLYDSTLIEEVAGSSLSRGMSRRVWPFDLAHGAKTNCRYFGSFQGCSSQEHWPGMFNVPVWQIMQQDSRGNTKGVWSMDYAEGRSADDVFNILKQNFDAAYNGNRAPIPIFIHTPWLANRDQLKGVMRFVDYALQQEDTYLVSIRQMLAWMQHPEPADQLTAERLGCGNPGGAPGSTAAPAQPATAGVVPHGPGAGVRPTQPLSTGPWGALMAKTIEEAQQEEGGSQEEGA